MLRLRNSSKTDAVTGSPLVLIIDDEPDVATYLEAVLSDHGWRVRVAHRAEEGLETARKDVPDLVLLDVMMPERGGLSTLVAIRKDPRLEAVPVVLVTGVPRQLTWRWEDMLRIARQFRPDAVIEKPVTPEHLPEEVRRVMGGRSDRSVGKAAPDGLAVVTEP